MQGLVTIGGAAVMRCTRVRTKSGLRAGMVLSVLGALVPAGVAQAAPAPAPTSVTLAAEQSGFPTLPGFVEPPTAFAPGAAPSGMGRAAACLIRDGDSRSGRRVGSNPVRYEYANSPYVGVRYDSCGDVLKIYHGGFRGITHYNIRYYTAAPNSTKQVESGPGTARVYTLSASPFNGYRFSVAVQGCKRGGTFESSSCTRFSPTVGVPVTR